MTVPIFTPEHAHVRSFVHTDRAGKVRDQTTGWALWARQAATPTAATIAVVATMAIKFAKPAASDHQLPPVLGR